MSQVFYPWPLVEDWINSAENKWYLANVLLTRCYRTGDPAQYNETCDCLVHRALRADKQVEDRREMGRLRQLLADKETKLVELTEVKRQLAAANERLASARRVLE